jgi:hypothetical protein
LVLFDKKEWAYIPTQQSQVTKSPLSTEAPVNSNSNHAHLDTVYTFTVWPEHDSKIVSIDDKLKLGSSYVDTKCSDCLLQCVQALCFYTPRYNSSEPFFCLIPRIQKETTLLDNLEKKKFKFWS